MLDELLPPEFRSELWMAVWALNFQRRAVLESDSSLALPIPVKNTPSIFILLTPRGGGVSARFPARGIVMPIKVDCGFESFIF